MEYTTLGSTGMTVSKICLGCMSFGSGESWMLDEREAREVIERAIDLGITFFDTANMYSDGESEGVLGDVLADYDRDEQVVATKVRFPAGADHPNAAGLSRKTVEQELDNSLERLGMDTVDLYQTHRVDPDTPPETTLRALDDVHESKALVQPIRNLRFLRTPSVGGRSATPARVRCTPTSWPSACA